MSPHVGAEIHHTPSVTEALGLVASTQSSITPIQRSGTFQPPCVWVLCLYALHINHSDIKYKTKRRENMCTCLFCGVFCQKPQVFAVGLSLSFEELGSCEMLLR